MKTHWYLTGLAGLMIIGNFAFEAPDSMFLRFMLYTMTAGLVGYIIYHEASRWRHESHEYHDTPDKNDDGHSPALPVMPVVTEKERSPEKKAPESPAATPPLPANHNAAGVTGDQASSAFLKKENAAAAYNNPAVNKDISDRLVTQSIDRIKADALPSVRTGIIERIYKAAKGDVQGMLDLAHGFSYGDAYLLRDPKIGIRWMGHAVAYGAVDMLPMLQWFQECDSKTTLPTEKNKPDSYVHQGSALEQIEGMVGLVKVKKQIHTLINRHKLEKLRFKNQLPSSSEFNLNLAFMGNPGTGKTTAALLLGGLLRDAGLLKKGHVIEVSGSSLIDKYVGTIAQKMETKILEAIGGIFFIDEAYGLTTHVGEAGKGSSGAMEATTALITLMNKYKGKVVFIVAGYPEEMRYFLEFNPGLKSRFREIMHFDNYSTEELVEIYLKIAHDRHYILTEGCKTVLEKIMHSAPGKYAKHFGNARFAHNLFEETLERVANRVAQKSDVTREDLTLITPFDINDAGEELLGQHKIG